MRSGLILLAACVFSFAATATDSPAQQELVPTLAYQGEKSHPVTYEVDFSAVVTAPYHTKLLKVWLPLPQTDAGQQVEEGSLKTFPMQVKPQIGTEKTYGNKFAYFEFANPQGAQIVRHRFKITVWEMRWGLNPANVKKVTQWPAAFEPYLRAERNGKIEAQIRTVVRTLVPVNKDEASDLAGVMRWVNATMKYDHGAASLTASAEHALATKTGHCSDYHWLCAAMGRALGYPTRVVYGINPFPKNSPSHCKFEAYLPPYGWVCFDVSETQRVIEAIQKDRSLTAERKEELIQRATARLNSGFRDNTWFLQTRGTDYDLVPPARKKVAVVRTIYGEADGEALPEPDPANPKQREFSWMTVHRYTPNRVVEYPFKGWQSLQREP